MILVDQVLSLEVDKTEEEKERGEEEERKKYGRRDAKDSLSEKIPPSSKAPKDKGSEAQYHEVNSRRQEKIFRFRRLQLLVVQEHDLGICWVCLYPNLQGRTSEVVERFVDIAH